MSAQPKEQDADHEEKTRKQLEKKMEGALKTMAKSDPWVNVELARRRISGLMPPTIIVKGRPIPNSAVQVYYKCDHMRRTGAYKERGGLNALMCLSKEVAKRGVIAASAGNHAQALAFHGSQLGVGVTVVMPRSAPMVKVQSCRSFGANVVLFGSNFSESKKEAERLAKEKGYLYINGYDHPDIISGAGTCGLEIVDQVPDVDVVVVPTGGGGLIAGVALAIKRLKPHVKIIGVESEVCPNISQAIETNERVSTPLRAGNTLADGLAVEQVGENAFELIKEYVDKVITVPESYIARAILHMLEVEKMLVEGAGATGVAGIISGRLDADLVGKKVVTIITGGNIDITVLGRVIDLGLKASGRLHTFDVAILNSVGSLSHMIDALAKTGASVKTISQETPRVYDVFQLNVHLEVETINEEHWQRVVKQMSAAGYKLNEYELRETQPAKM
uniref:Threonine ammonia-lyase n=1 Tax=Strigomonas oncopelti TaxID=5657 RepID=U5KL85_STROO|nr:threonine ammonia-lyase [Strigomonas oncopelti]